MDKSACLNEGRSSEGADGKKHAPFVGRDDLDNTRSATPVVYEVHVTLKGHQERGMDGVSRKKR
jgi:hypothetical protein